MKKRLKDRLLNIMLAQYVRMERTGTCETLCEMELCEQFKQSAQALELLHERKMWNEQKPYCLSAASLRFLRMILHILSEC